MKQDSISFFPRNITKEQRRDTGMALVLVLLLLRLWLGRDGLLYGAIAALVVNMTFPQFYRPLAVIWLGLSNLLGTFMSRVILTLVFFCVVTPIGVIRRVAGKDSLRLKGFKAGDQSVMLERNHTFIDKDLEKPY